MRSFFGYLMNFERYITFVVIVSLFLIAGDVISDAGNGQDIGHLVLETVLFLLFVTLLISVLIRSTRLKHEVIALSKTLASAVKSSEAWRDEAKKFTEGLSGLIHSQFTAWNLSSSESDIALMLIKGFSLKEIAHLRGTSERTVRQQALAVYGKSGLGGRAELAAYFLEDLLVPNHIDEQRTQTL